MLIGDTRRSLIKFGPSSDRVRRKHPLPRRGLLRDFSAIRCRFLERGPIFEAPPRTPHWWNKMKGLCADFHLAGRRKCAAGFVLYAP